MNIPLYITLHILLIIVILGPLVISTMPELRASILKAWNQRRVTKSSSQLDLYQHQLEQLCLRISALEQIHPLLPELKHQQPPERSQVSPLVHQFLQQEQQLTQEQIHLRELELQRKQRQERLLTHERLCKL